MVLDFETFFTDRLRRHQLVETYSKSLRDDHKVIHSLMRRGREIGMFSILTASQPSGDVGDKRSRRIYLM